MSRSAPVAPPLGEPVKIVVTDPGGIVLGDRFLKAGATHTVPAADGAAWIAGGRARPVSRFRYVALGTVAIGNRVAERGELVETTMAAPTEVVKSRRVLELGPDDPIPDPLPRDPLEKPDPRGPRIRVRTLRDVPGLSPMVRRAGAGEEHEIPEADAVFHAFHGAVEVLGRLSAAGSSVLQSMKQGNIAISYEDEARQYAKRTAAGHAKPNGILLEALEAGVYGGKFYASSRSFRLPEDEAAALIRSEKVRLLENPSPYLIRLLKSR